MVNDGMASVVAAGITHDEIGALGEEIDNLTFPLVAPLRANHRRCSHPSLLGPLRPNGSISDDFVVTNNLNSYF